MVIPFNSLNFDSFPSKTAYESPVLVRIYRGLEDKSNEASFSLIFTGNVF